MPHDAIVCALLHQRSAVNAKIAAAKRESASDVAAAREIVKPTWDLSAWMRKVVLIVYILCNYELAPCVLWLRVQANRRRWNKLETRSIELMVEDLFVSTNLDETASLVDSHDPADLRAYEEAMRIVNEYEVVCWGRKLTAAGIAPSSGDLLSKL